MKDHDEALAAAFDGQAARFEAAPVQSDPEALARLVAFAGWPADALVHDCGCGPGLVAEAFLKAGCRVVGFDLSAEMVARAVRRAALFAGRARFERASVFDPSAAEARPYDGAVSRYVLHHVAGPAEFLERQAALVRPGGRVVLCDHVTDDDPALADKHQALEQARDTTHTRNLTTAALVALFKAVGLDAVEAVEEPFVLDFDEWFDRGTPAALKSQVRADLLVGPQPRGFRASERPDGSVRIECVRALVRGCKAVP